MSHDDVTLHQVAPSVWWGWGDPAEAKPLPPSARRALEARLGTLRGRTPVALSTVETAPPRLDDDALRALRGALGAENVLLDPLARMEHAGGKSYVDLARARAGVTTKAPDAVTLPADEDDVARVLDLASRHGFVVIPFGGGTSVVAGLTTRANAAERTRPVVSLDLRRLSGLLHLDEVSGTATFAAGTRAPAAEQALRERGYTLGHFPQSYQQATIGGFVATRSAGQSSSGYGRIDDMVVALRAVTPTGPVTLGERSPASAAGPRLLDLVVGNEGAFAVITEATLTVQRAPSVTQHAAWSFPSFAAAGAALREMIQTLGHDAQPDVTRVSDASETEISLVLAGRLGQGLSRYLASRGQRAPEGPCLAILLWHDATPDRANARRRAAARVLRRHGAVRLPARVARGWEHGRFGAPYLRDELMSAGVFVETLETATTWTNLPRLYAGVRQAVESGLELAGTPGVVQCHVSHVYHSGASLYFTYLAGEAADRLGQWQTIKDAASRAIVECGGTITHHHAVGRDHKPYLENEIGDVGARMLRAVKRELDPENILNPGALVPGVDETHPAS